MYPFGRSPYAPSYQTYDPYEQLLLQQELQRRRQAEEYARRRQLEELNRRHAAQLEYARREAELQRRREAETLRRREMELEARRRKLSEPSHPRGMGIGGPGSRHSMFDGGVQDLFDALYGHPRPRSPSPVGRRSASSAPRVDRDRSPSVEPKTKVRFATEDSAVSDTEEPTTSSPSSKPVPVAVSSSQDDNAGTSESQQVDTSPSRKAVLDILSKFTTLKSGFTFPASLDFLPTPEGVSTPTPKLAYTPNNAPLHQYEHLLTGLLTQLDAVESYGDAEVRKARKDAVKEIEKELEELDGRKVHEWRRRFEPEPMIVESISELTPDVGTTLHALPVVDPASVPLPQGEDRELHADDVSEPLATSSTKPSCPHGDHRPHVDVDPQRPATPSELVESVDPPVSSSPSASNTGPAQAVSTRVMCADKPTIDSGNASHDATEGDYVYITPVKKVGDSNPAHGGLEDDWETNF
ncbi:hypothetical protein FRC07_006343 [Ceratobasidium sp. 392]|nr:hypothetical protein FRC07_006343 [Ceratobasidium sp. 392]